MKNSISFGIFNCTITTSLRVKEEGISVSVNAKKKKEYQCQVCNAKGCKLWRDNQKLFCVVCSARKTGVAVKEIDEDGVRPCSFGVTEEIGDLTPALPKENGGFHPHYADELKEVRKKKEWWKKLPTHPEDT